MHIPVTPVWDTSRRGMVGHGRDCRDGYQRDNIIFYGRNERKNSFVFEQDGMAEVPNVFGAKTHMLSVDPFIYISLCLAECGKRQCCVIGGSAFQPFHLVEIKKTF